MLLARLEHIEKILPPQCKGQAERLVGRALLTLAAGGQAQDCPPLDFVRIVTEAAEMGLAIDGRLGYVVRYKDKWVFQPSYMGLVAVARRAGIIRDADSDVVCANDHFVYAKQDDRTVFEHRRAPLGSPRGEVIGAYTRFLLPGGGWKVEVMDRRELDAVQARAPAKNGPWRTDTNEMRKKTTCKRGMKFLTDDPGIVGAIIHDDQLETLPREEPPTLVTLPVGRRSLRHQPLPPESDEPVYVEPPEPDAEQVRRQLAEQELVEGITARIAAADSERELEQLSQQAHDDPQVPEGARRALAAAIEARREQLG